MLHGTLSEAAELLTDEDIDKKLIKSCEKKAKDGEELTEAEANEKKKMKALRQQFKDVLEPQSFVYVHDTKASRVFHAECKMISGWMEEMDAKTSKGPAHQLWVAGIMRPCVACFIRLRRYAKECDKMGEHVLHYRPRPGLLWVSQAALTGASKEDRKEIIKFLENDECKCLTLKDGDLVHDEDSGSDGEKKTKEVKAPAKGSKHGSEKAPSGHHAKKSKPNPDTDA